MPFKVFKVLFPKSTLAELNATINRSIVLKTYNQSNMDQFSRSIRHSDKCVKCRLLSAEQGSGPAWPRMLDNELLGIIRVMFETIDNKTNDKV